ncbi:MAG: hypothetical protein U1E05_26605 [Patescibacteria group bacterium]|nr:hypothetical protein [Patescibacteria group bacterium]
MRCKNILANETSKVTVGATELFVPGTHRGQVTFAIRPENIRLMSAGAASADRVDCLLSVQRVRSIDLGAYVRGDLNGATPLVGHLCRADLSELPPDSQSFLLAVIRPEGIYVLPTDLTRDSPG